MREFEQNNRQPLELHYDQGRDRIISLSQQALAKGEKQDNSPFIVALWGIPNSGKTHLAHELLTAYTSQNLSVEAHTDHQNFGTTIPLQRINALDVLIIEDVMPTIGHVGGKIEPYIHSLGRIASLRVIMSQKISFTT